MTELFEWADAEPLAEWYEPDGDPREALGRMARRLKNGGALYLGGGIGVESTRSVQAAGTTAVQVERYKVTPKGATFDGPLSAVTAAFTAAGGSKSEDTPGGTQAVSDPAIAARLHELDASEREETARIRRYELRAQRRQAQGASAYLGSSTYPSDDQWEQRAVEEARANLVAIAAERKRLLAGKTQEGEMVEGGLLTAMSEAAAGKPGTNWKQVGPAAKKKLGGILGKYAKSAHPFTDCVKDNTKRFGPEGAKKVCAVDKDLIRKSTNWRKGGKSVEAELLAMVEKAELRLEAVDTTLGDGAVQAIVQASELVRESEQGSAAALVDIVEGDVILLHLNGDERATMVLEGAKHELQHRHRDGQFANVLRRIAGKEDRHAAEGPDGELRVNTPHPEPVPVEESGLIGALAEAAR